MPDKSMLEELREQRASLINETSGLVDKRESDRQAFNKADEHSDEERSAFAGAEEAFGVEFAERKAKIAELDRRIDEQELVERRRAEAAQASRFDAQVTSEPLTYRRDNERQVGYFRDLAIAQLPAVASRMDDPQGAVERLQRHAAEMNVELPKREAERERRAQSQVDRAERDVTGSIMGQVRRGLAESPFERRTNPNRTDGQGGYFVKIAA